MSDPITVKLLISIDDHPISPLAHVWLGSRDGVANVIAETLRCLAVDIEENPEEFITGHSVGPAVNLRPPTGSR